MIVTLLTDYGLEDEFAGVCRGVILGINPEAEIVDITHGIPRHDVRRGALVLRNALRYMPGGVHAAIVDPQVGTERRAVVIRCADGRVLVGPDNGLLSLAWEACGGVRDAIDVTRSPHRLEPVSATFHGRDVFAPVAAHLSTGAEPAEAGQPLDPDELVRIVLPDPEQDGDAVVAHVIAVDRFGNVALNVSHEQLAGTGLLLGRALAVETETVRRSGTLVQTFADVQSGQLLVYEDSYRTLALAINRGDAASELGLGPGGKVRLVPR